MKRSAALAPLSRDHHHALDAARRLRRATAGDASDAVGRFLAFFDADGRRHFAIEEELVLPALSLDDGEWAAAVERVRVDHADIRAAAVAVEAARDDPALDDVRELGDRLRDHVRFEERVLFPMLEARSSADALEALGRAVQEAEATGGPG